LATKRMTLKRMICMLLAMTLALLMCITCLPGTKLTASATANIPSEYAKVAESDSYKLYLYEPTMSVILENKTNGKVLYSTLMAEDDDGVNNKTWTAYMQSGVVLTAIKGANDTYQVDLVSSPNEMSYQYTDNGFRASIEFKEYDFGLDVEVALEGDELVVRVPEESIFENGSAYIGTVSLFPMMGYSYLDAKEGYMFIPDGNGALIYLDDKDGRYSSGFSQVIYGADAGFTDSTTEVLLWERYDTVVDPEKVLAPVFGMMHTADKMGYLAIVEDGNQRASIEAHPNGVMVNYNRCFAKFTIRKIYVQPLNNSNSGTVTQAEKDRTHSDLQVRYVLLTDEAADYSGMAVAYREYLQANGMLEKAETEYKTRVDFLGTDREEFMVFKRAVTMTTTEQMDEMFADLQSNGVDSLLAVYKGWQAGGLYDVPITKYKADGEIGGTSAVTKLIADWAEKNYDVYLYNEALLSNPEENNTTFNAVKKVNKRKLELTSRDNVYQTFNYVLPFKTETILDKFVKSYTNKDVKNLALAGITNNIFSYSYSGKFYTRFDCANTYENIVSNVADKTNLILEEPFAFLWKDAQAFLDMPLGSSAYMYEDEEIPFMSMVLKGSIPMYSDYVNFQANKNEFKLQMIEAGIYPSFYLTYEDSADLIYTNSSDLYSTKYDTYRDTVIAYDTEFKEIADATEGAFILRHDKVSAGVNKVTYDNGVVIYVNYTDKAVTADDVTVDALSAKVVK